MNRAETRASRTSRLSSFSSSAEEGEMESQDKHDIDCLVFDRYLAFVAQQRYKDRGSHFFSALLILAFFVLIGSSTVVIQYFKCHEFKKPNGGSRFFLYRDYSLDCESDRYLAYLPFAILMILVFPVGSKRLCC